MSATSHCTVTSTLVSLNAMRKTVQYIKCRRIGQALVWGAIGSFLLSALGSYVIWNGSTSNGDPPFIETFGITGWYCAFLKFAIIPGFCALNAGLEVKKSVQPTLRRSGTKLQWVWFFIWFHYFTPLFPLSHWLSRSLSDSGCTGKDVGNPDKGD
ncbi:hypothetical protein Fuma_01961 [Fuerstiella marisgermanici]|uniref:Uncharacterized protein n=1 Tax=Fuerstiella marisgermanici TaxID=1891926 RepID=A0A1P8WE63_9PLAN|nr:hypothetical protein Fuma_01961 [Fuerstiella marisgermanici]